MNRVRWFLQPPVFVTLLVLAFVLTVFVSREIKANKILSALAFTTDTKHTIIVEADIELEIFHMEKFQQYGRMLKVDGSKVYLRAVSTKNLEWFARQPWVKTISPWDRE